MKKYLHRKLCVTLLSAAAMTFTAFPAFAADIRGGLDSADQNTITGWAYNKEDFDDVLDVELHIYNENSSEVTVLTTKAENYRADLSESIKDGWHAFEVPVNWDELSGSSFEIQAYGILGEEKVLLSDSYIYSKDSGPGAGLSVTDDVILAAESAVIAADDTENQQVSGQKGDSLGMFTTTGYCGCEQCSSGHALTYSGTVPQANHTISADLEQFPIGTKLLINDIIYTVEDKGTSVTGNKIDIFYGSHEEAYGHGVETVEVFSVK